MIYKYLSSRKTYLQRKTIENVGDAENGVTNARFSFFRTDGQARETSMSKEIKTLERAALDAHARGQRWNDFWREHRDAICCCHPADKQRYHKLVCRLLGLLISGDTANVEPLDAPWEADDCLT